ncbi:MAG: hypothetical protein R8K46_06570 [Mariprofundaceae bacterium]
MLHLEHAGEQPCASFLQFTLKQIDAFINAGESMAACFTASLLFKNRDVKVLL